MTRASTLAELRQRDHATTGISTLSVRTSEGDIVIHRPYREATFTIASEARFIRMALALVFADVPLPVAWIP